MRRCQSLRARVIDEQGNEVCTCRDDTTAQRIADLLNSAEPSGPPSRGNPLVQPELLEGATIEWPTCSLLDEPTADTNDCETRTTLDLRRGDPQGSGHDRPRPAQSHCRRPLPEARRPSLPPKHLVALHVRRLARRRAGGQTRDRFHPPASGSLTWIATTSHLALLLSVRRQAQALRQRDHRLIVWSTTPLMQ